MNIEEYIKLFETNFEKAKSHLGWAVDKRIAVMITCRYSAATMAAVTASSSSSSLE